MADKPIYNKFEKLTDIHIRHIIIRRFKKIKPGKIFDELTDENAMVKYGFEPVVGLTIQYLYKRIGRIPETTIAIVKQEYLNAISEVIFSHKRIRLEELTKLYLNSASEEFKRKCLKDLKEEVGEEALNDAIARSGNLTISDTQLKNIVVDLINKNEIDY